MEIDPQALIDIVQNSTNGLDQKRTKNESPGVRLKPLQEIEVDNDPCERRIRVRFNFDNATAFMFEIDRSMTHKKLALLLIHVGEMMFHDQRIAKGKGK